MWSNVNWNQRYMWDSNLFWKQNNNQFFSKFSKKYTKIKVMLFYLCINILFGFLCIISAGPTIECAGFVGTNLRKVYAKFMIIHFKIFEK